MPGIKISGITNIEDAKWAAILGVEFISVSLDENSLKKISLNRAIQIKNELPSYTKFVAEFGELDQVNLREIDKLKPDYIQLKCNPERIALLNQSLLAETVDEPELIYEVEPDDEIPPPPHPPFNKGGVKRDPPNIKGLILLHPPLKKGERGGFKGGSKGGFTDEIEVKLLQLDLKEVLNESELEGLKDRHNMADIIIEGDWALSDIKKACGILQPYAWSIKGVIEKSPRKINYTVMKEYIREITLW